MDYHFAYNHRSVKSTRFLSRLLAVACVLGCLLASYEFSCELTRLDAHASACVERGTLPDGESESPHVSLEESEDFSLPPSLSMPVARMVAVESILESRSFVYEGDFCPSLERPPRV